jgi:hypothetical protein
MVCTLAVHVPIIDVSMLPVIFGLPLVLAPLHIAFLELVIDPACSIVFEAEAVLQGLWVVLLVVGLYAWLLAQGNRRVAHGQFRGDGHGQCSADIPDTFPSRRLADSLHWLVCHAAVGTWRNAGSAAGRHQHTGLGHRLWFCAAGSKSMADGFCSGCSLVAGISADQGSTEAKKNKASRREP